ncbi:MAG: hypothetical protein AAF798_13755 [Bacteroidota bacterium]
MNTPLINHTFWFVKSIYQEHLPYGFSTFQFDQSMDFKNALIAAGLHHELSDTTLEHLALAALLHNVGCIEGQYEKRSVSQAIAQQYLAEKGCSPETAAQILGFIEMTCPSSRPKTFLDRLIQQVKFHQAQRFSGAQAMSDTVGDFWP